MRENATIKFSHGGIDFQSGKSHWKGEFSNLFVIRGKFFEEISSRVINLKQKMRWINYQYRLSENDQKIGEIDLVRRHNIFHYSDKTHRLNLHFHDGKYFTNSDQIELWGEVHRDASAGKFRDEFQLRYSDEELLLPAAVMLVIKEVNRRNLHF